MESLINKIKSINPEINKLIELRLQEFSSFKYKSDDEWFSELCFCILTANSRQKTSAIIQKELGAEGFLLKSQEEIKNIIMKHKHRFHNNKSKYIIEARKYKNIKSILSGKNEIEARDWLVQNIKGIGYKEASHFLRNTGHENLAIIDRHILAILSEHNLIQTPKIISPVKYLEIEQKCKILAKKVKMSLSKLDLSLWYLKTGEVLK